MLIDVHRRRLAALLGLSAVWLLLLCGTALAHARLVEEYPADGDVLSEPPAQVQLQFNEPIEAEFDPVEVYDEQNNRVDLSNSRVSENNTELVLTDLQEGLPEGSYTLDWRVTSADGHPISGAYGFSIDASASDGSAGEPIEPIERSAEPEETSSVWGTTGILVVLLLVALAVAAFVGLRRWTSK